MSGPLSSVSTVPNSGSPGSVRTVPGTPGFMVENNDAPPPSPPSSSSSSAAAPPPLSSSSSSAAAPSPYYNPNTTSSSSSSSAAYPPSTSSGLGAYFGPSGPVMPSLGEINELPVLKQAIHDAIDEIINSMVKRGRASNPIKAEQLLRQEINHTDSSVRNELVKIIKGQILSGPRIRTRTMVSPSGPYSTRDKQSKFYELSYITDTYNPETESFKSYKLEDLIKEDLGSRPITASVLGPRGGKRTKRSKQSKKSKKSKQSKTRSHKRRA